MEPGEEFDIDIYIQFSDNDEAEGIVSGYIDINSKGIYELTIQCTDKSNNYVEKKSMFMLGMELKLLQLPRKTRKMRNVMKFMLND